MTLSMKNTKAEIIKALEEEGKVFSRNLKKEELLKLYKVRNFEEEPLKEEKFEIVPKTQTIQKIQTEEKIEEDKGNKENLTMVEEYFDFLKLGGFNYKVDKDLIIIFANKKHIFVKVDIEKNWAHVFTILNKKISEDMKENKANARNILTLKSLKALKSYTLSNAK